MMDKLWHKLLRRPYRLANAFDVGAGTPIVLLHGIGRTGQVWQHVMELLAPLPLRVVALDLLGFGGSPKPTWPKYDIDDHARAVIASIKAQKLGQPAILVGHSMGCLVAVRVARLRPDLVRHLVLYEMPLYEGLPEKRVYRLRTDLYFRFYRRVMKYQPVFNAANARLADRLAQKVAGLEVTEDTWLPFIRSLENTIMKQTTAQDIKKLDMAADVIYGSFDMLVIRGKPQLFFGKDTKINAYTIRARHVISVKASRFIVERIKVALAVPDDKPMLG
jgi:pimeloyl-ACP methyl ester carboxylesterase